MNELKVSIASMGEGLDSQVGAIEIHGMSRYWLLVETGSNLILQVKRLEGLEDAKDPGIEAIRSALSMEPDAVIATRLGPGAFDEAKRAGLRLYGVEEGTSVRDALERLDWGILKPLEGPSHPHGTHGRDEKGRLIP